MSTALVDIKAQLEADRARLAGQVLAPTGRKISIRGKVFTFPDGVNTQNPIETVILDFRNFNKYFKAAFSANNPSGTTCFALSKELDELAPHGASPEPQAESCAVCAKNEWGSATNGGKGKACRNCVRLAVVAPDADPGVDPLMLEIPPTSIKSWSSFVRDCASKRRSFMEFVCEISFNANEAYPNLIFKNTNRIVENVEQMFALREKAQLMLDAPPAVD